MKILLAGSHGLIGSELKKQLEARGDEVTRLVRHNAGRYDVLFDLRRYSVNQQDFENFDAYVHFGGANIGEKRLTERRKTAVWDSRVVTTGFISEIIKDCVNPPKTFICASAVGFYGNAGDVELTESSPKGLGFFAELCDYWEKKAKESEAYGVRVASMRNSVVLDRNGGSLERLIPLFKLGIGGRLGSGKQWMSWIHLQDEVRAIMHVLDTPTLSGAINTTSPQPVNNGYFTAALAQALHRPAIFPTPRPLLIAALGRVLTDELLLTSQRVIPKKLLDSGFEFEFADIHEALKDVVHDPADDVVVERLPEIQNPDAELEVEKPEEWTPRD